MDKCKDCLTGCKAFGMDDKFVCERTGTGIYKTLPEGMRLAVKDDIFPAGRYIMGKNILVFSVRSGVYHANRTSKNTDLVILSRAIADGVCWVKI